MRMMDVVIVGGGPAGLNAALFLGRCNRRVLLVDANRPRNAVSRAVNGFLTRDGTPPHELRRLAREQLAAYPCVDLREGEVVEASRNGEHFELRLADREPIHARKLLLAPGLVDDVPDIPGARDLYGRGVYNCPYCDGWEHRDQGFAVYAKGTSGRNFALELMVWSRDIVLCTDGPAELSPEERDDLDRRGIGVREDRIVRLEGDDGQLGRVVFASGESLARDALFFTMPECHQSPLVDQLGCDLTERGAVETGRCEKTNVPGLYVAGDASRRVHFAIVAAAEGAMAAFAINAELLEEDLRPQPCRPGA